MGTVVDLSEQFALKFGEFNSPILFDSFELFEEALRAFQHETGANYRIRTTNYVDPDATPRVIQRRVYFCVKKGQPLSQSSGIRSKPSGLTACPSLFNVNRAGEKYRVTSGQLTHNHAVDSIEGSMQPCRRRLSADELEVVRPWLMNGTCAYQICKFIRDNFRKHTTTKDVVNLRTKCNREKNAPNCLRDLSNRLNTAGRSCCLFDSNNRVTHFIFMTREQELLCHRYPELLGMDATYKTCHPSMHLFILVAIDCSGTGIPVCFGWLAQETTVAITIFLQQFKLFVGSIGVRTMITDDNLASQQAITIEFPEVHHLLCRVHILRNVISRHPNPTAMRYFHIAMRTRSRWRYLISLCIIQNVDPGFYNNYLLPRLVRRSAKWVMCRSPQTPTFGRRDNNFVEATHHAVKRHGLTGRILLWNAVKKTRDIFDHLLNNRQVYQSTAFRAFPLIPHRAELDSLVQSIVPKAVELLSEHLGSSSELSLLLGETVFTVNDQGKRYLVDPNSWTCSCPFHVEYLLPCRHALHVYEHFSETLDDFPITPRWTRLFNSAFSIEDLDFEAPRMTYVATSGVSALMRSCYYLSRRVSSSTMHQLASEIRGFADVCGFQPASPFMVYLQPNTDITMLDSDDVVAGSSYTEPITLDLPMAPEAQLNSYSPVPVDLDGVPISTEHCGECQALLAADATDVISCIDCFQKYHIGCAYVPDISADIFCVRCHQFFTLPL